MRKFVLLWFDKDNQPRKYRTEALTKEIAQANFGSYQAKKKLHKRWKEIYEIVGRKLIKI